MAKSEDLRIIADTTIKKATRHAIYSADAIGLPTDPTQREAWNAAVDAQIQAWEDAGISNAMLTGGATQSARITATSNKGASLSYDYSRADEATQRLLAGSLSPLTEAHLYRAGLMGNLPGVIR